MHNKRGTALPIDIDQRTPLGRVLSVVRESMGMTRAELADAVGLSEHMIAKVEQGAKSPSQERFEHMCRVLEIHPDLVFESMRSPAFTAPPGLGVLPDEEMPEELRSRIAPQLRAMNETHRKWWMQAALDSQLQDLQPIWLRLAAARPRGSLGTLAAGAGGKSGHPRRAVIDGILQSLAIVDDHQLAALAHVLEALTSRPEYLDELLAAGRQRPIGVNTDRPESTDADMQP